MHETPIITITPEGQLRINLGLPGGADQVIAICERVKFDLLMKSRQPQGKQLLVARGNLPPLPNGG